jgi:ribonuclease BN (tRNA processing enzyme)
VVVTPFPVRHPDRACGFRIELPDATIVYMPDNEPAWPDYPLLRSWKDTIAEFICGADLLIHDAMFTDSEYETRHGWGHGTTTHAIQLAEAAAVPHVMLFHHHPERTDTQLQILERSLQLQQRAASSTVAVAAAVEGQEIDVQCLATAQDSDAQGDLERG